ncbi:glycosyltransferase family 4 protein [Plebeiibacterium sediminum]|uniref:Glycosyltransferase family 4 protein n=1 Tax=Plebeiibacterium sediminum TaxID=2992112 RepID=A0AAE3M607_9BACT|nr:glycosyltransferase family 4 protein [Plebeiobacterium sediminum]MCW3787475.1 glycosyltransferase family 4 protein [Plebeiobacterium sediminum]
MKRLKILHAIRQGQIGGGESHVLDLVEHLNPFMYESIVLSFTDGPMIKALNVMGIKSYVIYTEKAFSINVWNQVKEVIKREEIDIVHAHGTRALSNVFSSAKYLNIPLIYTVHGWSFHPDQSVIERNLKQRIEKFLTNKCDRVICVSKSNQSDGIERFDLSRSRVIYNAISATKYNYDLQHNNIRNELNIPEDIFLLGYIVRFTNQKDPFTLIHAFNKVVSKYDKVKLLMVGEGDLKIPSVELVKDLNLSDKVIFETFRTDVPAILKAIDVYCLPSLWEGFPIGILEAMAMKVPVVATPVDGNKELINNHITGELFPIKDPKALADIIISLIENPKKRELLSQNAQKYVLENFRVEDQVEKVGDVYQELIVKQSNNIKYASK